MRRPTPKLALALLLSALALAPMGCAALSPQAGAPDAIAAQRQDLAHRLSLAEQSFRLALDLAHEGVALGLIRGPELKPWVPIERAIGEALDAAEAVAADKTKGNPELEAAVAAAEASLPRLAPLSAWLTKQKAAAAPAPK